MTIAQIKLWIAENFSWLGFVIMGLIGAAVGQLKAFEASTVEWPVRKHFCDYVRRAVYASFIGLTVYLLYPYAGIPSPVAFIITGILSVFGSESIDFMYAQLKDRLARKNQQGSDNARDK